MGAVVRVSLRDLKESSESLDQRNFSALLTELMQGYDSLGKVSYEPPILRTETKEAPYPLVTSRGRPFLNSHDFIGICADSLLRYNVAKELHTMLE